MALLFSLINDRAHENSMPFDMAFFGWQLAMLSAAEGAVILWRQHTALRQHACYQSQSSQVRQNVGVGVSGCQRILTLYGPGEFDHRQGMGTA